MTTQSQPTGLRPEVLALAAIGLFVSLAVVVTNLASQGYAAFNSSSSLPWGLPVATYVFFVLTSTGLTFVASLAMVFGMREFYAIAKRCIWLAVATLVAGFIALAFELGHPFRMLWAIATSFQFTSPLTWMGLFYLIYLVFLLLKFQKVNNGDWDSRSSRSLGIASFVAVVLAHGTLGAAFGMLAMRPFWYGPLIPLYFLLTAALSGAAFAVLVTYIAYGSQSAMPAKVRALMTGAIPKAFAAVLGITIVATVSRVATGLWSNAEGLQVWQAIVRSPWFWIEAITLVAAFVLMLAATTRNQGNTQLAAALLAILSLAIGRYEFVVGGQLAPMFKGSSVAPLIDYAPSVTEWMLTVLALCITFTIYAVGERLFDLSASPASPNVGAAD